MLKKVLSVAVIAGALGAAAPSQAAFLTNWWLHPDGTAGTATQINEFLDIVGPSGVLTTVPVGGSFTFQEKGAVEVTGHDGSQPFNNFGPIGANSDLAAVFTTSGNATLGGTIQYTAGTINVYSDAPRTFGTTAGTYGADTGTLIATFTPVSGSGAIDLTGIPNGTQTITARATFLAPGYFFAPNGTSDLSTQVATGGLLFGFATTNASRLTSTNAAVQSDIAFPGYSDPGCLPGQTTGGCTGAGNFVISNNGQFRLVVPEPGSIALVGLALAGLGFAVRRRQG